MGRLRRKVSLELGGEPYELLLVAEGLQDVETRTGLSAWVLLQRCTEGTVQQQHLALLLLAGLRGAGQPRSWTVAETLERMAPHFFAVLPAVTEMLGDWFGVGKKKAESSAPTGDAAAAAASRPA